jgi:hypothetical protein
MALTGRESGRDLVIDGVLLSVDAVGIDLEQHPVVTKPPGTSVAGTPLLSHSHAVACRKS